MYTMEGPPAVTNAEEREPDSGVFPLQGARSEDAPSLQGRGVALFLDDARRAPLQRGLALALEYGMFASGMTLAALLLLTRWPMRLLDDATGLELRRRFVELLARVSPG
jgi:hypothetical protein